MDLTERVLEGELMDAPDLEATEHQAALNGLQRVNWLSGTANIISRAIIRHCRQQADAPLRILDLACGGGDVTLAVRQKLAAAGLHPSIEAWDRSPTAIAYATQRMERLARASGADSKPGVQFLERDVQKLDGERQFDVVMCTLFLHHLTRPEAGQVLSKMYRAARQLVLVDDLRRTWAGYRLAQLGCHFLTRSRIVHVDGPLSVRAAFTEAELLELSSQIHLPPPAFVRHWPQRFLMRWERST
jgi:2-polyprenyl-3-methyl-5-hydroxy-6-metoxy-1,4-benzoquinol methylase